MGLNTELGTRTFCRKKFCRTVILPMDILSNGQYDERTFRGKGILPKRQLAENREILGVKLNNIVSEFDTYENTITYCEAIAHNL